MASPQAFSRSDCLCPFPSLLDFSNLPNHLCSPQYVIPTLNTTTPPTTSNSPLKIITAFALPTAAPSITSAATTLPSKTGSQDLTSAGLTAAMGGPSSTSSGAGSNSTSSKSNAKRLLSVEGKVSFACAYFVSS